MDTNEKIERYFPYIPVTPFRSATEQRNSWMLFLDMCAVILEGRIGAHATDAQGEELVGAHLDIMEFAQMVDDRGRGALLAEAHGEYEDYDAYGEEEAVSDADSHSEDEELLNLFNTLYFKGFDPEGGPLFALSHLMAFHLRLIEKLAVLLAVTVSVNRKYERIFKLLQEEGTGHARPTVGLCLELGRLFLPAKECEPYILFSRDSFLNRFLLKQPPEGLESELARPLALKPLALSYILGEKNALASLARYAAWEEPFRFEEDAAFKEEKGSLDEIWEPSFEPEENEGFEEGEEGADTEYLLHPDETEELASVIQSVTLAGHQWVEDGIMNGFSARRRTVVELVGEAGSGRRFLASQAALRSQKRLLVLDLGRYLQAERGIRSRILSDLIFQCIFCDAVIYVRHFSERTEELETLSTIAEQLVPIVGILIIGTSFALPPSFSEGCTAVSYRIELAPVTPGEQGRLWESMAAGSGMSFEEGLSLDEVVSKYSMNPGRIREVLYNLKATETVVRREALEEQIRRSCASQFGKNATRLRSPFTWEDLMIDEKGEKLLKYAANRVRFRKTVYDDYGFGKKLPYGRGVAIVLYGPPGTGKTMAAQVLAHELGLDIYRIDLSMISSKYIGETEKNLSKIFEAAKNSNAILFFDEADALFSKRTSVESSHDKYANAETSYLLQKIEEYDGVSVLATNNLQNFDVAFKRRMTYIIPIEAPNEQTRLRLWEKVFPPDAPIAVEVDFALLARAVELTGASIKNVALFAANLAAAEGRAIAYEDLIEAVDLECQKIGQLGMGEKLSQAVLMGI